MKKLVSAAFAVAVAAAAGAAFAQEDPALKVAPNALRTIESTTPAPMRSEIAGDSALSVAPNAQQTVVATEIYVWEVDYSQ